MKPTIIAGMPPRPAALATLLAPLVLAGCALGPDYARPTLDVPGAYRAAATETADLAATNSLAALGWREVLRDPQLHAYIAEALTNSWDIKIAAARVLQAEAQARITRSQFFPSVGAGGDWTSVRTSEEGPAALPAGTDPETDYSSAYATMASYEVDLWGRIRRANEAALARLLATEAAQMTVRQTLVAQVATAYLTLLELDHELEISRRTLAARKTSLELTTNREEGGVASMQDVHQAEVLVATAEATIVDTLRRLEQKENELCILLGRNPGALARGAGFLDQNLEATVPPGLPSDLISRRPDILAAEQQLVAANADIGQARAAFFPRVALTGLYGYQSVELSELFTSPARMWQFVPSVSLPVFTGGRLKWNLKLAEAVFEESLAEYRKTVQGSFREVSDSLVAYRRTREYRARVEELTEANRRAAALSNVRYEGGVTSYLEVLYNEQQLFSAELGLAQSRLNELLSVVSLYRALGGGAAP
jgi:multidrug efflux system outer membrane protein